MLERPFRYYCDLCELSVVSMAHPVFYGYADKTEVILLDRFIERHEAENCARHGEPESGWPIKQYGAWGPGPYPLFVPDRIE